MHIEFEINIDPKDESALLLVLGGSAADLPGKLTDHARAALTEYLECYLGRRAYARGSDILEHRLSLLVKHVFKGRLPTAAQVADLFQMTLAASRTLIRNTFSKYRFELDGIIAAAAKEVLERVTWASADQCLAKITVPNLVEVFNRRLLAEDAGLKEIARTQGAIGTYAIARNAYAKLCGIYGAVPVAGPGH